MAARRGAHPILPEWLQLLVPFPAFVLLIAGLIPFIFIKPLIDSAPARRPALRAGDARLPGVAIWAVAYDRGEPDGSRTAILDLRLATWTRVAIHGYFLAALLVMGRADDLPVLLVVAVALLLAELPLALLVRSRRAARRGHSERHPDYRRRRPPTDRHCPLPESTRNGRRGLSRSRIRAILRDARRLLQRREPTRRRSDMARAIALRAALAMTLVLATAGGVAVASPNHGGDVAPADRPGRIGGHVGAGRSGTATGRRQLQLPDGAAVPASRPYRVVRRHQQSVGVRRAPVLRPDVLPIRQPTRRSPTGQGTSAVPARRSFAGSFQGHSIEGYRPAAASGIR